MGTVQPTTIGNMKPHICEESDVCICNQLASEPNENCPVHGNPYPPRCGICGRFMSYRGFRLTKKQLKRMSPEQIKALEDFWYPMHRATYPDFISRDIITIVLKENKII